MGASLWSCVTSYRGSVEATLQAAHEEAFAELYGDTGEFRSIEEMRADDMIGMNGTGSILDLRHVVESTAPLELTRDYDTIRPLAPDRLLVHFGTERPAVRQYEDSVDRCNATAQKKLSGDAARGVLAERGPRWTGCYVLLYTEDRLTHVGFFGSSGD